MKSDKSGWLKRASLAVIAASLAAAPAFVNPLGGDVVAGAVTVAGMGATANAAGLVATTHEIDDAGFIADGPMRFNDSGVPAASVIDEGRITNRDPGARNIERQANTQNNQSR